MHEFVVISLYFTLFFGLQFVGHNRINVMILLVIIHVIIWCLEFMSIPTLVLLSGIGCGGRIFDEMLK